jgi:hypothetical protein
MWFVAKHAQHIHSSHISPCCSCSPYCCSTAATLLSLLLLLLLLMLMQYAHPNERSRRRCLLVQPYLARVCPDMQTVTNAG